jgi:hypothetical protein
MKELGLDQHIGRWVEPTCPAICHGSEHINNKRHQRSIFLIGWKITKRVRVRYRGEGEQGKRSNVSTDTRRGPLEPLILPMGWMTRLGKQPNRSESDRGESRSDLAMSVGRMHDASDPSLTSLIESGKTDGWPDQSDLDPSDSTPTIAAKAQQQEGLSLNV